MRDESLYLSDVVIFWLIAGCCVLQTAIYGIAHLSESRCLHCSDIKSELRMAHFFGLLLCAESD